MDLRPPRWDKKSLGKRLPGSAVLGGQGPGSSSPQSRTCLNAAFARSARIPPELALPVPLTLAGAADYGLLSPIHASPLIAF